MRRFPTRGLSERMTLFELFFGLAAVILGLALTNIVASLHRLALVGRKVRWAPEPVLLAILVVMIIVFVWLGQWFEREITEISAGRALLQVAKMMTLYFAAASCLPEPDKLSDDGIDLYNYYDRTRGLSFGALILGLMLFQIYFATSGARITWVTLWDDGVLIAIYVSLIFIRSRWFNVLALTAVIGFFGVSVTGLTLVQTVR